MCVVRPQIKNKKIPITKKAQDHNINKQLRALNNNNGYWKVLENTLRQ